MGMTIEFYSADPQELTDLFAMENDDNTFFKRLETYPMADFSFHLWIPEDLNSLCLLLHKQNSTVPLVFRDLLAQQLWYDNEAESLTLLAEHFTAAIANLNKSEIEQIAVDWSKTFPYKEPPQRTPAYQGFRQLHKIAQNAIAHQKSLILYLAGHS